MSQVAFFEIVSHARLGADLVVVRDADSVQVEEGQLQFRSHGFGSIGVVGQGGPVVVFLVFGQVGHDLPVGVEAATGDRTHDDRLASGLLDALDVGLEAILVNGGVISLLIVVTKLNEDVVGLVLNEFVQFRGQGFQGGAVLGVVQDLGAAIEPLRKGRPPTGLFRDGGVADEPMVTVFSWA